MSESFDPYYQWLGIPPEEQPANHYQLLGIKWFEDNVDVISAAVDRQMLHLRTYQIGGYSDLSQRLMNEVVSAKLCLLDPKRKAAYDQKLLEGDLAESIESQKASGSPAFGPQLEALFDQADQAEPGDTLHKLRRKRWKPSGRFWVLLVSLAGGLLLVLALRFLVPVLTAHWLADNGGQPAPVPAMPIPKDADGGKPSVQPDGHDPLAPKPAAGDNAKIQPDESAPKPPPQRSTDSSDDPDPADAHNGGPPANDRRIAIPSEDARRQARLRVDEIYRISLDRGPLDKVRLAKRLLQGSSGGIAAGNPAIRYEMLDIASVLGAEGGNLNLSFTAIDKIGEDYEIDPLAAKLSRLHEAAVMAKDPARIRQAVNVADNLIDEALQQKQFDTALRIIDVVLRVCQRPDGKQFRKAVLQRRKKIRKQRDQYEIIQTAKQKLQSAPDDGEANLLLGRHLCFHKNDWAAGLPLLSKGSDEGLTRLARRELDDPPQNADEEVILADAWWTLAATKFGPQKQPLLLRAAHWYKRAQFKLTIGPKTRHVDKRLGTITRLTDPKDK